MRARLNVERSRPQRCGCPHYGQPVDDRQALGVQIEARHCVPHIPSRNQRGEPRCCYATGAATPETVWGTDLLSERRFQRQLILAGSGEARKGGLWFERLDAGRGLSLS